MRRFAITLLVLCLAVSCSSNPAAPAANGILVNGSDMGNLFQNISLTRNGEAVTGATVTVNGTAIPEVSAGFYQGQLPALLDPGATVTLEIKAGSDTVKGVTTVAPVPVITSPSEGTAVHPGTALPFSWTSSSSPDEFLLQVHYIFGGGGTRKEATVVGTGRSGSVDTTGIPAGATDLRARLFAYGNGTFTGSFAAGSKMHVRTEAAEKGLTLIN